MGVLAAVGWMFSVNYLHRDVKPENILVSEDGEGILADFGLVIRVEEAGQNIGAGTVDYSAKEVSTTGSVLQSDLFSVAVCFVEAMIRRCPFDGEVGGVDDSACCFVGFCANKYPWNSYHGVAFVVT